MTDDVYGYGYMLAQGATALPESWQALPRKSHNHLMLGHLLEWFYTYVGGIRRDDSVQAYKKFIVRPEIVGDLRSAEASFCSPYGLIRSEWTTEQGGFDLLVEVPANTTARIYVPAPAGSQVFAGEELAVGDEFYLTCVRWSVFVRSDGQAIERGFVNILREGSDYLVFLLTDSGMENRGLPLYFLNIDQFIAPVFCYEDIANTFVTPAGRTTYVPYTQVKDNEFFAASQAGLDAWSALKQEMLRKYPAA